ncbi:MAG: hypothetical protein M3T96_04495 [Acidobacteriota bacterium]|nr:hypothetical protein [Acidobacteriota bacterium]
MQNKFRQILISPLFLGGLALLLLNDFLLKAQFHNFLTGKISDFTGLFVFALFWTAFFPKWKTIIFSFIVVFFAFWKSPFSSGFIDSWNSIGFFGIGRTVDYTDLIAFSILPPAWIYSEKYEPFRLPKSSQSFALTAIALVSVFAFTATSPPRENYYNEEFNTTYKIEKSPVELLKKLQDYETEEFYESRNRNQNLISVGLELNEKVCDAMPHASFEISKDGTGSQISLQNISYQCREKISDNSDNSADKKILLANREKLKTIFEKEVLGFLKN